MMSIICGEFKLDDMWDITGNICEEVHGNLWGFIQEIFVGAYYHGEYLSNVWEIFMWAQDNVWARVCIFVSGLMKLKPENLYLNTNMSIEALPLHNSIGPAMAYLFQETSSLVHAFAKKNPCKASPCTRGAEC